MRQRAMIAMAMANDPDVVIADEPTTALDVTVQAQVLEVLKDVKEEFNSAIILITHDLGVVAGMADRLMVMYAGRQVEFGGVDQVYEHPRMPYTLGLIGALPRLDSDGSERLVPIKGSPPSLINLPVGCPFQPRCPLARQLCNEIEPELVPTEMAERPPPPATSGRSWPVTWRPRTCSRSRPTTPSWSPRSRWRRFRPRRGRTRERAQRASGRACERQRAGR